MSRARAAFDAAFNVQRDPRSPAYRAGCLYILTRKLDDGPVGACPYPAGSAENDAWYAGCDEAHAIVRRLTQR